MKKTAYIFVTLCALAILMAFPSCRKASHNGKLDAQWQIMRIENHEDGTSAVPDEREYICINLHVVNLFPANIAGNMNYDKDAATVTMDFPYNRDETGMKALAPYGILSNPVVFRITELDGKQLVLSSESATVICRRF